MFYLEMLAAPMNHTLQHGISARNQGTELQSREQAIEGDSLQGKGADCNFLKAVEGDYHSGEKNTKWLTPLARSPFCISPKMTDIGVWVIIFPYKSWTLRLETENRIIGKMLKIWENSLFWWVSDSKSKLVSLSFGQTRHSSANNWCKTWEPFYLWSFSSLLGDY